MVEPKLPSIARLLWEAKYRAEGEREIEDTWRRVARALATAEPRDRERWERVFFEALEGFRFLPGGRILAGAGTARRVTLLNCFVMGTVVDSLDGIFDALKEGATTMQQGGGVGYDFSTLRPLGAKAHTTGTIASGPVSFMRIWDAMCSTILSTGARRGAMMATLRCDHPDVEAFIDAKARAGDLTNFNLSLLVTDDFMRAVRADAEWPLVFPLAPGERPDADALTREWSGQPEPVLCRVHRVARARSLWDRLVSAAWERGDPGIIFVDRVNRDNNLHWRERISATNPCGEEPLPPYGACDLGSIELSRFVVAPFEPNAHVAWGAVARAAGVGLRMLDDVLDTTRFPLERQRDEARATRRVGLGITGLADTLAMLGLRYGSEQARAVAAHAMRTLRDAAYAESARLAEEKGPFAAFDARWLDAPFPRTLPTDLRDRIARTGVRNSHALAIAPTGSISLLAGNVSGGIEPIFSLEFRQRVLSSDGTPSVHSVRDHAWAVWLATRGGQPPPPALRDAPIVSADDQLAMQAELQPLVDGAISKTVRMPEGAPRDAFDHIFGRAYDAGVKGCTAFRPNALTGVVLSEQEPGCVAPSCSVDREAD